MKYQSLILVALLLCTACTKNLDPWNNTDPNSGNNGQQQSDTPTETDPTYSDVDVDDSDDEISNTTFDCTISITYSGNTASVSGSAENVAVEKDGARVTVTNSGEKTVKYILSGSSTDGFFKLYSSKKQAIVLKGLSLANTKGAAINNQSKKRTFVVLEGTNTLADAAVNSSGDYEEETADEDMKAAFFSEGQLIFSGSGSLTVSAVGKAGITSDDYVRFMDGSNVKVTCAKGHGVRGKDAVIMSGGKLEVSLEATATGKKCVTTDSLFYISGGAMTLTNKASAGTVDSELTGAAGIKADQTFVMKGGQLAITSSGKGCKGISCDKNGYFEGGSVTVAVTGANYGSSGWGSSSNSVSSKAIKFDGNLEFSGADVTASASSHEAIESKNTIYISGGCISAISGDDCINSSSTMTISGGVIYAYSTGNDGLDANGNLIIKGGTVYAIGKGSPEVAIDANTEQNYRLYIQGGTIIAIGGLESNSSVSESMISTSWVKNTFYTLCDGDTVLFSFKAPASGGTGLYMLSPDISSGSKYTLKTSATISGETSYFNGILSLGGTATGGSETSVTASSYSSGGNTPGGGGGGGNPGGPGGRW